MSLRILMVTNTYAPHIGGVARSATNLTEELRRKGHKVMVVAPVFDGLPEREGGVVRFRALTNFNDTKFSVVLPPRPLLARIVKSFRPDIVHSHHPFLLGATGARLARARNLPLIFTHHTLYERYTHYLPADSVLVRRLALKLATRYANRCTHVFAPSQSVAEIIAQRGVHVPISVIPSGIRLADFCDGEGARFRAENRLPADSFVVGYVGRLEAEKNLPFLANAMARFLRERRNARALIVGQGSAEPSMRAVFRSAGVADRVVFTGQLVGSQLADAYHAMDVYAFASLSETQGLVVAEAMASGRPVIALDAPGVREMVRDGHNGRLLHTADQTLFADSIGEFASLPDAARARLAEAARKSAAELSLTNTADMALALYAQLRDNRANAISTDKRSSLALNRWAQALAGARRIYHRP